MSNVLMSTGKSHFISYGTPISINYNWSFGALSGIFVLIQVITGVLLAVHYTSFISIVFENMEHIMRDVNNGWLLRYMHANSASFFFICMYLHIFRGVFYKSYLFPRNKIWNSGVIILILSIVTAFIGYVLPRGQMSYWGATVITNLVTAIPIAGGKIILWIWGDYTVNSATLIRFYDFHYLFAIILLVLIIFHLSFLHEVGSSTPVSILSIKDKIKFYRYFYLKDVFIFICFLNFFLYITFYFPNLLGHSDNYIKANSLVTPTHIVPEWYFLPFYAILRSIDNKLIGVIAMLISILILLFLPFCKLLIKKLDFVSGIDYNIFFVFFISLSSVLWLIGSLPAEYPYTLIGKVLTFFYFINFFINFLIAKFHNLLTYGI